MATSVAIANEALAEIAAGSIAAFDENSREASEVNRFFNTILEEILDWTEWGFAIRYVALARITNDRPAEWMYVYAKPTDCANPKAIRAEENDVSFATTFGPTTAPFQDAYPLHYLVEGDKIYTNVENATLVYSTTAIEANELPPLVRRAMTLELAARIAYPVKKDAKLADTLVRKAEVAKSRAIADEENKNPRKSPRYVSDAEYARLGFE